MISKDILIGHCKRMVGRYKSNPNGLHIYLEHKIFLELLTGRDVNEMFDKNDEYIDNESVIEGQTLNYGNTKQFRINLLLHFICYWSGDYACGVSYCGYG